MELARTLEEAERQRAARAGAVRQRNAKVGRRKPCTTNQIASADSSDSSHFPRYDD